MRQKNPSEVFCEKVVEKSFEVEIVYWKINVLVKFVKEIVKEIIINRLP